MTVDVRLLTADDLCLLERVAPGVFDDTVNPAWAAEFLTDPRHHLVVALDESVIVGMASAVHYIHPDKAPQLWINEIGVASTHQRRSIGRQLLDRLVQKAGALGCTEAWVLADRANIAAHRLYESAGATIPAHDCIMYTFPVPREQEPQDAGETAARSTGPE